MLKHNLIIEMENNDKKCYRRQITSIKYSDNSTDWFTYLQKHKLTDGDSLSMWDAQFNFQPIKYIFGRDA